MSDGATRRPAVEVTDDPQTWRSGPTLLRHALKTLRERPRQIITLAVAVLVVPQFLEAILLRHSEHLDELGEGPTGLFSLVLLAAGLATSLGFIFYAGVLDHVVAEHQWGAERRGAREVALHLPWITLVLADLFVTIVTAAAAAFLVIPGIIVYTYLGLIGPVVNIDRLGFIGSVKRTASLAKGNFWLVFWMMTVPVIFEGLTEEAIHAGIDHDRTLSVLLATVLGVAIAGVVGVVEVTLAHELVRRKPLARP